MRKTLSLFLFSMMFLLLVGCVTETTTEDLLEYADFEFLFITDKEEQLSQPYDTYYLYFYGPYCTSCNSIKQEALTMIGLLEDDILFLVEVNGLDDINPFINVEYTPSLVTIEDNQVTEIVWGGQNVLDALEALS